MLRTRPGKRHASISGGYGNPGGAEAEALICLWQAPGFRREVLRICAARPSRRAQASNAQDPRGAAERASPGEKCAGFAFRGQTVEPRQKMQGIRVARPNAGEKCAGSALCGQTGGPRREMRRICTAPLSGRAWVRSARDVRFAAKRCQPSPSKKCTGFVRRGQTQVRSAQDPHFAAKRTSPGEKCTGSAWRG